MILSDLIICDDIRQEINRKFTLVGVYGDSINFLALQGQPITWPIGVKLGIFIRLKVESSDEIKDGTNFEFYVLHNNKELARFDGSIITKEKIKDTLALPLTAMFPIPGPGKLTFQLKLKSNGNVYQDFALDRVLFVTDQSRPNESTNLVN